MKVEVVKREAYEKTEGPIMQRSSTETLEFLERMRKLPGDSILLVEPAKGESVDAVRSRLYSRANAIQKKYKPGFVIRFALAHDKTSVIIWKEQKTQS